MEKCMRKREMSGDMRFVPFDLAIEKERIQCREPSFCSFVASERQMCITEKQASVYGV
jgi:hypothetical protein